MQRVKRNDRDVKDTLLGVIKLRSGIAERNAAPPATTNFLSFATKWSYVISSGAMWTVQPPAPSAASLRCSLRAPIANRYDLRFPPRICRALLQQQSSPRGDSYNFSLATLTSIVSNHFVSVSSSKALDLLVHTFTETYGSRWITYG